MKEKYYWNGPYNPSHITAFYQKRCYVCTQKKNLILFICLLSGLSVPCACGSDEELL